MFGVFYLPVFYFSFNLIETCLYLVPQLIDHNILLLFENNTLPDILLNKKYYFVGHCGAFRGLKCVAFEIVILVHLLLLDMSLCTDRPSPQKKNWRGTVCDLLLLNC